MGVGNGGQGELCLSPRIFMHDTNKVEESLMVLFFGLVFFSLPLSPWKFSADALVTTVASRTY